jgi:phosphonate transport system substrate-binding protein
MALLLAVAPAPAMPSAAEAKLYVFGVFPYLPPRDLEKVFAPIAAEFGRVLGREVRFVSSSGYDSYARNLDADAFDIAFMQPFDYVRVSGRDRYLPLATRGEPLKALLVTAPDKGIAGVADLKGKRIAMPPEEAAVSHLVRAFLARNGLEPGVDVKLSYFRSHASCMQQVLIDAAVACATAGPALRFFNSRMNVEMRTFAETEAIPHTLFATHARVPEHDRRLLLELILSWSDTPEGRAILERGKFAPFVPVTDAAYDVVRKFPRAH